GGAGLGLLEHSDDLAVGETRFLQGNLLGLDYEKFPLLTAAILRGDYRTNVTSSFARNCRGSKDARRKKREKISMAAARRLMSRPV
ncbi:hypothetical protein, partial [Thiobacillus sp.]|uniref:hypothetical protein n=1 Tax=Thiobacillus sp. TaxID=924 RepID=UPI0025EB3A92